MKWDIEYTDEFESWWETLSEDEQDSVAVSVGLLEENGPSLPFPYSSGIIGSEFSNMRELRTQHAGEPYRTLYAFDPRRCAILLIGGNKAGDDRWYEKHVPIADRLYNGHVRPPDTTKYERTRTVERELFHIKEHLRDIGE